MNGTDFAGGATISMITSLMVIFIILGGAMLLARKLRGGRFARPAASGAINILATRPMGGQCALMIVEAEGRRFLIAASRQSVTSIGALGGPAEHV